MSDLPVLLGPVRGYDDLRTSVVALVRSGALAPHTRLPSVRGLATELGLAANTVARAYRELEAGGIVETRGRLGTFVLPPAEAPTDPARAAAADYARRVAALGVSPERALDLVRAALADL